MQWMNQSGTLKVTHKVRVKFSMGNYMDTVDCNVVHMNACHLLLGRPWQFDVDATHGGRSNNYFFVHKGVHHALKPMPESAIKAVIFPHVKVLSVATHRRAATGNTKSREVAGALAGTAPSSTARNSSTRRGLRRRRACHLIYTRSGRCGRACNDLPAYTNSCKH